MPTDCISYQNSGYFSKLIVDYLNQKAEVQSLYHRFPSLENFKLQLEEKSNGFPIKNRVILSESLEKQYFGFQISESTKKNITSLKEIKTFTVTTGHQLNLFTGPLYFLYKIVSTINLAKQLQTANPECHFVPVYWMATEDHDFEEINYFNFKEKKIHWNHESKGPVGRQTTEGLDKVFDAFSQELGAGIHADFLKELFKKAYLNHSNLADATRYLANELFGEYGLVIVDGDASELKQLFAPFAKRELIEELAYNEVSKTLKEFNNYDIQVNPREINLFYITDTLRERIVNENGTYKINATEMQFSESQILEELTNHPERFSPNVILRPLYQEIILPNLCYIGGGGELAYWLELKSNFAANNIPFPILMLRNSALLVSEKQLQKMERLELSASDIFSKQADLLNRKTELFSQIDIDFSLQKQFLSTQFDKLTQIAAQTDKSFIGSVKAQEAKQLKGLENLEKRFLKAEKRKYSEQLSRITALQNELFPNHSLQERKLNFSEFYLEYGPELIQKLFETLDPFSNEFSIVNFQ